MTYLIKIFIILFLFIGLTFAQEASDSQFEFLPEGINFIPLKANHQEAKIGVLYYPENANLKVDIGNTVDVIAVNFSNSKSKLTFGIEFMAYALSTSYKGKRLQIDALDGFFGGNASFTKNYSNSKLLSRFRMIHNSAHLVDGHYDNDLEEWKNNKKPVAFAKDFAELTVANEIYPDFGVVKYYGSGSFSFLVRPDELKRFALNIGIEVTFDDLIGEVFNNKTNLFLAHHLSFFGLPKYTGNNHTMLGVKFGEWSSKGIMFYLSYYQGNNIFSEYYYERVSRFGIGFFVDFI
jgi:hypothetical protein